VRYYVDTEFNGNEGQLLSIALVSQDGERKFYAEQHWHELIQPWVREHVVPLLAGAQMPRPYISKQMRKFLEKDSGLVTIVGDWPEDIVHVASLMLRDMGKRNPPIQCRFLMLDLPGFNTADHSAKPHNALDDAVCLREYVETQLALDQIESSLSREDRALLAGT